MTSVRGVADHAATRSFVGVAAGYAVIAALMTLLIFGIPWLIFWGL